MDEDDDHREYGPSTVRGADGRFVAGNPGKPTGSRNHASLVIEALMEGSASRITKKAVAMAARGDGAMIRLIIERIAPPIRRDRPVRIALPPIESVADHPAALAELVAAMGRGEIAPAEAEAFATVLAQHRAAVEVADLEARIAALEERARPGPRAARA